MKSKGFTLVEVLITVVILTVGIIAIHQGFSRCLTGFKASEQSLYGTLLLERAAIDFQIKLEKDSDKSDPIDPKVDLPDGYQFSSEKSAEELNHLKFDRYVLSVETPTKEKVKEILIRPAKETL